MKRLLFLLLFFSVYFFNAAERNSPKSNPLSISARSLSPDQNDLSLRNEIPIIVSMSSPALSKFKPDWVPTRIKSTLDFPNIIDGRSNYSKPIVDHAFTTLESEFVFIITNFKEYSSDTHVMENVPTVLRYKKADLTKNPERHTFASVVKAITWAMLHLEEEVCCC